MWMISEVPPGRNTEFGPSFSVTSESVVSREPGSIRAHFEVREIAGMGPGGIGQPVVLAVRIEVRTRRHEVRGLALPDRVDVKPHAGLA